VEMLGQCATIPCGNRCPRLSGRAKLGRRFCVSRSNAPTSVCGSFFESSFCSLARSQNFRFFLPPSNYYSFHGLKQNWRKFWAVN
jgi:hypothetical protein